MSCLQKCLQISKRLDVQLCSFIRILLFFRTCSLTASEANEFRVQQFCCGVEKTLTWRVLYIRRNLMTVIRSEGRQFSGFRVFARQNQRYLTFTPFAQHWHEFSKFLSTRACNKVTANRSLVTLIMLNDSNLPYDTFWSDKNVYSLQKW